MSLNDELWGWLGKKPEGDFTTDLSLCFKWLVPLVYERDGIEIVFGDGYCALEMGYGKPSILRDAETAATAFCLAVKELIRSERK